MNKEWEKEQKRKKEKISENIRKDLNKKREYHKKLDEKNSLKNIPILRAKGSTLKTIKNDGYFEDYQFSKKTHIYSKYPIKSMSGVLVITFQFYKRAKAFIGGKAYEESVGLSKKHRFPRDYKEAFRECMSMGAAKIAFSPDGYEVKSELYSYWVSNNNAIFK